MPNFEASIFANSSAFRGAQFLARCARVRALIIYLEIELRAGVVHGLGLCDLECLVTSVTGEELHHDGARWFALLPRPVLDDLDVGDRLVSKVGRSEDP